MPHYKSFRKKNRYKTLKYTHKNKRKNSRKNKYRVGRGPIKTIKRFVNSLRSRLSSRARTHQAPNPGGPPTRWAEPIDDDLVARMYAFIAEEERRLQRREEEAPSDVPPLPLPSPVLDIESERERKIQSLLEETSLLLFQIDRIHRTTKSYRHNSHIFYTEAVMRTLEHETHVLIAKLESPDIIYDSRIMNARSDLFFKLDTTARSVQAIRYAMDHFATIHESQRIRD